MKETRGISISGSELFEREVEAAVELLSRSTGFVNCIVGNIEKIIENRALLSGGSMKLNRERGIAELRLPDARTESELRLFFLACTIAHEAFHNELFKKLVAEHGERGYLRIWKSVPWRIERQCVEYEIEIATELKFPIEVIQNLRTGRGLSVHDELLPEQRRMLGRSIRNLRTMPDQE